MNGKVIVTGASGGIGSVVTRELAAQGCSVVMACRNPGKAEALRERILARVPQARIEIRPLDLGSLASVRAFAEGLGTCWVRGFDRNDVIREFGLPDNLIPEAMMTLGYPSDTAAPGPKHAENIPIEEMVKYL